MPAAFAPGSIQGQDGWSGGTVAISTSVDQAVSQNEGLAHTGVGSFRVSNSTVNGNFNGGTFAGWPFSPGLGVAAGQPDSGAQADLFSATFWFRSVSSTADGSNMEFNLGNADGTDRNSYIRVANKADGDGGLQIEVAEPVGDGTGDFYLPDVVVSNLERGVWHRIDVVAEYVDGAANDFFTLSVNGNVIQNPATQENTFLTWEGYFNDIEQPYRLNNRLFFRSEFSPSELSASFSDTGALGFAIDDVSYYSATRSNSTQRLATYSAGFEPRPAVVYVDDLFADLSPGTPVMDADPVTPGDQPAIIGEDAFADLVAGLNAVAPSGQVLVFAGSYTSTAQVPATVTMVVGGVNGTAVVNTEEVQFASNSTFAVDLKGETPASGYDQLVSTGSVDIGAARLNVTAGYTPAPGTTFTLISAAGGVLGRFAGLPEGAVVPINGLQYKIRYTSNSVVLAMDTADLAVTVTDDKATTAAGGPTSYTITVTNIGPFAVSGAQLAVSLPATLLGFSGQPGTTLFNSTATGGATGNTNGVGAPADVLSLPAGASVTYTVVGTVSPAATDTLTVTASITAPANAVFDPVASNNTATDTTTVFTPDTTRPVVQILPAGPFFAGTPTPVTVVFSEAVTGFTAADLFVTNGLVSGFSGSGSTYSFTLNPVLVGPVVIQVPDGAAFDAAGNPSVAGLLSSSAAPLPVEPAPLQPRFAAGSNGVVQVYSPTAGLVQQFNPFPGYTGEVRVATADLNGDGVPEVVVGAGPGGAPHVKVFDGASGAEVASFFAFAPGFTGGVYVAADGGRVVVGAGEGGGPNVKTFTPAGGELSSFFAYDPAFTGGVRVAAGDVNGDGTSDIVTGAGPGGAPHVKVFDGVSGKETLSFFAFDLGLTNGVFVAAGHGHLAVGAGSGGAPHVKVFNAIGVETASFFAYNPAFTGGVRVALTDLDGDGDEDLITGAGPGGAPHVKLYSLPEVREVGSFFAGDLTSTSGVFVG